MPWPLDRWPTAAEIRERLVELAGDARFAGRITVTNLPETTVEGRTTNFVRLGRLDAGEAGRPKVVFTGGIHAREWAPPRLLTDLVSKLLEASVAGTPIQIGGMTRTAEDIRKIMDGIDLFIAPLINADGYEFSVLGTTAAELLWRKNRRPAPSSLPVGCSGPAAIGIDINRNFDVLWDFEQFYIDPAVVGSSKNPCAETFIGPSAFSEPEARNVRSLLNLEPSVYVDCHMHGQLIFHSWGVEDNDPIAGVTPALNPGRVRDGVVPNTTYKEPINSDFLRQVEDLANLMADATQAAGGTRYTPQFGALSGSLTGAADDFAFAKNLGTARAHIKAFTIECGTRFAPPFDTLPRIQNEVQAALLTLLRNLVRSAATSSSSQSCRCA